MKKRILIMAVMMILTISLNAEDKEIKTITVEGNELAGKLKAGIAFGYPTGLTAGWRLSNTVEANLLLATNFLGFTVGVSPLFTIVNLEIEDEIFPISVGPAVNLNLGFLNSNSLDILAMIRAEYSFVDIPLNLFLEGGLGVNIGLETSGEAINFGGSAALGVRYIF